MECPSLYNPADFFLCQLNSGPKETLTICGKFGESEQGKALASEMEDIRKAATKNKFIYGVRNNSECRELIRNDQLFNNDESMYLNSNSRTSTKELKPELHKLKVLINFKHLKYF